MTTTFGFAGSPSPGFSSTLIEPDTKSDQLHILACRPTDLSAVPAVILDKWTEIHDDDIWSTVHCESCNCEVLLTFDQAMIYLKSEEGQATILCMVHAAIARIQCADASKMVVHHPEG